MGNQRGWDQAMLAVEVLAMDGLSSIEVVERSAGKSSCPIKKNSEVKGKGVQERDRRCKHRQ